MKSFVNSSSAIALGLILGSLSIAVQAQSTPASSPPKMEKIEEIPDSGITISKPEPAKSKMVEKRVNGKVTEVQVKSGKSSYTVKANPEIGNAPKGTVQGDANRAAQWTILEFGGKKESKEVETIPTLQPAPAKAASASASASASMPNKK
ncbi:MAG: hypothetical protein Q7J77_06080 [Undibacterium sp.]|jgi:hypothetical protein|nr:hypothetical protein [Undibacterium sp.]